MKSIYTVRSSMLLLLVLTMWIAAVVCQSPSNPAFWELPRRYNVSAPAEDRNSHERVAVSQDFQTIYAGSDLHQPTRRILFYYSTCCNSTNTTFEQLQRLNGNNLRFPSIQNRAVMALVDRGNCSWSEKLSMAAHLSATNGINLTALMVTDNQSYPGADYQLHTPQTVNQAVQYSTPLPNERNISFMEDNDLRDGSSLISFPVYFGPFKYGDDMQESIINVNNNNMNDSIRVFWDVAAYLAPLTVQERNGPIFTRGYLSYIIALAAVFLVALFAGVIFLRWWRVRQLREQMDYETQLNAHAYNMQMRMQAKPLPVDVVNALPITRYTPGQIKNGSCAICLDDFEEGESDIRILGCGHGFCVLCIDPWLTQKSTLCPICKYDCMPPDRAANDGNHAEPGESSHHAAVAATAGTETNNLLRGENHDSSVELQQIVTHPTEQQPPPQQHPEEQSPSADSNNNALTTQSSTNHCENDDESSIHKDTPTENNNNNNNNHNRHS
ncbi:hypothetical protein O0I10_005801 [Lichtheimia ornata]|uniref:RING-type domain-containing protein n=1 Tax=Lichtheimia ornata TaxID=688661 RepID=A0AAD7XZD3_9FUNG|nr:uncharacterized protein O0I10_005801 [Lichtheimia ornata]KAJ8658448.1 hypothetical protein O0I10_005801 [Lichtheimia ornata]